MKNKWRNKSLTYWKTELMNYVKLFVHTCMVITHIRKLFSKDISNLHFFPIHKSRRPILIQFRGEFKMLQRFHTFPLYDFTSNCKTFEIQFSSTKIDQTFILCEDQLIFPHNKKTSTPNVLSQHVRTSRKLTEVPASKETGGWQNYLHSHPSWCHRLRCSRRAGWSAESEVQMQGSPHPLMKYPECRGIEL